MTDDAIDMTLLIIALVMLVIGGVSIGLRLAAIDAQHGARIECGNQVPGR